MNKGRGRIGGGAKRGEMDEKEGRKEGVLGVGWIRWEKEEIGGRGW